MASRGVAETWSSDLETRGSGHGTPPASQAFALLSWWSGLAYERFDSNALCYVLLC